jgi:uroporphyrinogen-III synthase
MQYVILTRSLRENTRLAKILKENGIESISCPQITLKEQDIDLSKLTYSNIIITSKFAAEIVAQKLSSPVKAYVVGEESALILSTNPAITVKKVYSKVSELEQGLRDKLARDDFTYLSGNYVTKELPCQRLIIYNTTYTNYISHEAIKLIKAGKIKAVLIYSKRTAISFKETIICNNLTSYMVNIQLITLSKQIGLEFVDLGCKILYCNKPREVEMINLLKNAVYG